MDRGNCVWTQKCMNSIPRSSPNRKKKKKIEKNIALNVSLNMIKVNDIQSNAFNGNFFSAFSYAIYD